MLRITTLCLLLLLAAGAILPFANSAHGVRQNAQMGRRYHHRYHSKAWWRRYRTRLRKKRAAALAHRNAMLALPKNVSVNVLTGTLPEIAPLAASATAPAISKPGIKSSVTALPGQINLSVVALSRPNPAFLTSREESRMLAGVAVADLRRIVIDKMVVAGGWVINDYVREFNGARVFVVTARTPKDSTSPEKAWTFYFTEMGGRIYGLTTDSPVEDSDRMQAEAEHLITSMRANPQVSNR